jgi:ADP-heptose:LPS heptosyltransferase/glycosyltransferase involved in cell wall biosynthesis
MNIVCFGQQNWDFCWTGKQQLMTRLAQRGHRVLYIDPDMAFDVRNRRDHLRALLPEKSRFGIRDVGPGTLYVFTYHYAPALRWRLNGRRHEMLIPKIASLLGFDNPVVMSMHPDAAKRIASLDPQAVLYQAIDEWTGFGQFEGQSEAEQIRAREEDLIRSCEIAFGVSPVLKERMEKVNPRTYLLESGADVDHFAPGRLARAAGHPAIKDLPHPRLGFVGQVDARLDQDLLVHIARSRPDWHIILAGRQHAEVDFSAVQRESNIHLLGYQPYDQLPNVVREFDVCLVPYKSTNLTNSCSPLKVFEYLATGKPVVSTPLLGLGSSRDAVRIATTADEFVSAVERALANPEEGRELRLARAEENSWHRRVDFLESCMREAIVLARRSGHRPGASRPKSLSKARRILVARSGDVREVIATLPMISTLRKRLPEAQIILGVQSADPARQLLADSKDVQEIRELSHSEAAKGFDLTFPAGNATDPTRHASVDYMEAAGLLNGSDPSHIAPKLPWTREEAATVGDTFLRSAGVPEGARVVVVHAGAEHEARRWPAEFFSVLIDRVLAAHPDTWIALTRTGRELPVRLDIGAREPSRVVDAASDLRTTLGIIARADAVVASDNDAMHLARTIGTPLVAVLGPENDSRWGPSPVGSGPAISLRNLVPCAPCERKTCNVHYCMRSIKPEKVVAELEALLAGVTSDETSYPLVRKHTRMNWDAVAHAGFTVPEVSVLLLRDGAQQLVGRKDQNIGLDEMLSDISLQTYSNIRTYVVRPASDTSRNASSGSDILVDPTNPAAAWRSILDQVSGEFLAPMIPEVRWVPGTLAAHIAALTRFPDAAASYPQRAGCDASLLVVRRSAVEGLLRSGSSLLSGFLSADRKLVPADVSLPLLLSK